MELHSIYPGELGATCSLGKGIYRSQDLGRCHLAGQIARCRGYSRRRDCLGYDLLSTLASAVIDLEGNTAALGMDCVGQRA
jgi:hypothetical protein